MDVEVVLDQDNRLGVRETGVGQLLQDVSIIDGAAVIGDLDVAPAFERGEQHEQVGGAVTQVFAIVAFGPPGTVIACRARRQRGAHLADQLLAALVPADHRPLRVMRAVIDLQHVFHVEHERGRVPGRDAPHPPQMRFERILF